MLPARPGHVDPQRRLGLGEVQPLDAVGVHRGRGFPGVESARVHLGNEGDEIGLDAKDAPKCSGSEVPSPTPGLVAETPPQARRPARGRIELVKERV